MEKLVHFGACIDKYVAHITNKLIQAKIVCDNIQELHSDTFHNCCPGG